ncbi:MAG: glycosyltransferase family 2 protein [Alphaproteobacteria bacterium]|jgi:glycosyltransferase involved in cell wall biosynthesis|nr:glycosyltransferase family 2 protein [Alphaproteobacteria bacterium]MBP9877986.1 glycosyltransferase family 2 protein [Alphaproteobacteria bacterium]
MKLSIILPSYNRKHSLPRALSALTAGFCALFEAEVIVIDDASTDGTEAFLRESYPHVTYIKHEINKGAAAARNTGIRCAKGKYLAFLDSDDEWLPHKIAHQLTLFQAEQKRNRKIKASFTAYTLVYPNHREQVVVYQKPADWFAFFLKGCFISPGTTLMVDRSAYDEIGLYDETLKRLEDWDWLLRYSQLYEFVFTNESLARIYLRESHADPSVVQGALERLVQKWSHLSGVNQRRFLQTVRIETLASLKQSKSQFLKAIIQNIIKDPGLFVRLVKMVLNQKSERRVID